MGRLIFSRVLQMLQVLFVVTIVVFFVLRLVPGDPATVILGDNFTPEAYEELRREMGLDQPIIWQYLLWIGGVLRGDLGYSYFLNQPVAVALVERFIPTLQLAVLALIFALLIALPLGVAGGRRARGTADKTLSFMSVAGLAVPSFVLSLFMIQIFAVQLRWLPPAGYAPLSAGLWASLAFLMMPAVALGLVQAAVIGRIARASVLDVGRAPFVRTAVAKGAGSTRVTIRHVLPNSMLPILTAAGQSFGALIAGAAVIETIFSIPGIGQLLVTSIGRRDFIVIQSVVLVTAVLYVALNLLIDLAYMIADPRVRIGRK